jgi:hypothetical protein
VVMVLVVVYGTITLSDLRLDCLLHFGSEL